MVSRVARDHADFRAALDRIADGKGKATIGFDQIVWRVMQIREMCELQFSPPETKMAARGQPVLN
jgi:hypothetical protein